MKFYQQVFTNKRYMIDLIKRLNKNVTLVTFPKTKTDS